MRVNLALAASLTASTCMVLVLVLISFQRNQDGHELLSRHKSYYYNVFGQPDEFENALNARAQESRNALALHALNAREISLASIPAHMSEMSLESRVKSLESEVSTLYADLQAEKQKSKSTCPSDVVPVCSAENKCSKCPAQCGGLCQSLSSDNCGLSSCVTCPVGMRLSADLDSSTGSCEPCAHPWYDSSTGKITDIACNGGTYLSPHGSFQLASTCTLDKFGKALCSWTDPVKLQQPNNVQAAPTLKQHRPSNPQSLRMQWAKQAMASIRTNARQISLASKEGKGGKAPTREVSTKATNWDVDAIRENENYRHKKSEGSPWFREHHNGKMKAALTTKSKDDNPVALLKPGDYWKDPYERKYLKAPQPHDPASTLAHTVTGDYASPATWGNIYRDKETLDWCIEQFPWFEDRMKCIRTLHSSGPTLN